MVEGLVVIAFVETSKRYKISCVRPNTSQDKHLGARKFGLDLFIQPKSLLYMHIFLFLLNRLVLPVPASHPCGYRPSPMHQKCTAKLHWARACLIADP